MGRDGQPKHRREARDLRRRAASRQAFKRLLIVCEGEKTEPQYLNEIRAELRLSTANVHVRHGGFGTDPMDLVEYAEHLFRKGDRNAGIEAGAFDHIYVVFDRDEHDTYYPALSKAAALDGKLLNDERHAVPFEAIASVPCFEVWLLLHFEDVQAPIHRNEVTARLQAHLPGYKKGGGGHWGATKERRETAAMHAAARASSTTAHDGEATYTDMHRLVDVLMHLRTPRG
ncbi:RloB family protein [Ramlibacter sp.]|uniref:RloB family protein n=1 Tax=Ramlibacter sp. TaxID=1917967 RepID=UPI003D0F0266